MPATLTSRSKSGCPPRNGRAIFSPRRAVSRAARSATAGWPRYSNRRGHGEHQPRTRRRRPVEAVRYERRAVSPDGRAGQVDRRRVLRQRSEVQGDERVRRRRQPRCADGGAELARRSRRRGGEGNRVLLDASRHRAHVGLPGDAQERGQLHPAGQVSGDPPGRARRVRSQGRGRGRRHRGSGTLHVRSGRAAVQERRRARLSDGAAGRGRSHHLHRARAREHRHEDLRIDAAGRRARLGSHGRARALSVRARVSTASWSSTRTGTTRRIP